MADRKETVAPGYFESQAEELKKNIYDGIGNIHDGGANAIRSRAFRIGDHTVRIGARFVPNPERFDSTVDVVSDDTILYCRDAVIFGLYGSDATNPVGYRAESYHYGTCESDDVALASLDEQFAGQEVEVTDSKYQIPVEVSHEERCWDNPGRVAETIRSCADELIGKAQRWVADHMLDDWTYDQVRRAFWGDDFVRARRVYASELAGAFGHEPEHVGTPLTDKQSEWLYDIAKANGSIAIDTALMGYVPAVMPPGIYSMSMAGVLTMDEAWQVIATAISTVPTCLGDGRSYATWPRELVDTSEAREIVSHYQSTSIEVRENLVRDDEHDVGHKNVCLFMDDGSGIRKRYANLGAIRVIDGLRDGYLRVSLPANVQVFGYDDEGHSVHETMAACDVKKQMETARATYFRQRSMLDRTASTLFSEESCAMDAPAFSY